MKSIIALALAVLFTTPSFADITVSASNLIFGSVKVGSFSYNNQTVYIRNNGNEPENVRISGYCPQDFRINHNCYNLPAYGQCTMQVSFNPSRAGYYNCSYSVRDANGLTSHIYMTGSGHN